MRFEFATATRIIFGPGCLKDVVPAAKHFGQRVLIVAGKSTQHGATLNRLLGEQGLARWTMASSGEPDIDGVESGAKLAREEQIDLVVSIGGGSVIDLGKAIAAIATNEGDITDYLEVIGRGRPLTRAPLPFIAIPTTAGTGAEVTRNAVIASREHCVKVSLRSPLMLPKLAVIDPELTLGLPASLTASTDMDALTQLIEPFLSCRANPLTDGLCREGLVRIARSLRRAYAQPVELSAREDMALASVFSVRLGVSPWFRSADWRDVPCTARGGLRGVVAICDGGELACAARPPTAEQGPRSFQGGGAFAYRQTVRNWRRRRGVGARVMRGSEDSSFADLWPHRSGRSDFVREGGAVEQHEGKSVGAHSGRTSGNPGTGNLTRTQADRSCRASILLALV